MSFYRQNESIQLTSRYGFRIWERDGQDRFVASFVRMDEEAQWPIEHAYNLTKDDLFRMYVFIGGMLADEFVDESTRETT